MASWTNQRSSRRCRRSTEGNPARSSSGRWRTLEPSDEHDRVSLLDPCAGRKQGMRQPPATTRFFNGLGRRVAYFYVRRLMRSDVEWEADLPSGAKIIAANHPTTTDPFLMMSWPFEPVYILISEAAFKVPPIGEFLRLAGHMPVSLNRGAEGLRAAYPGW